MAMMDMSLLDRNKRCLRSAPGAILLLLYGAFVSLTGCNGRSAREPVTLTYLDVEWDTPDAMPGLAQDLQDFTRETGIQVRRLPRPDGSLNQLALWRKLLQRGASAPDVLSIDVIWSGMLSQYLVDLKPYFAAELATQDPVVVASYTVGDKVLAVPHHAYVGVLLYRPDLLRTYGYRKPPNTWDELEIMAARIQSGERAKGKKDFWGYVWQGGVDEDLTCSGLEWQISAGGGRIIEDDKTISINNPQARDAWQRAARWVGSISPPGVVAYGKWDAQNAWGSGKAAFVRGWQGDYSLVNRGWPFSGSPPVQITEFGVTMVPGGKAGRAGALGGNGLAASRTSGHLREALQLIRFLVHRDAELMRASSDAAPPKGLELYELPAIFKAYAAVTKSVARKGGLVARPSVVAGSKYEDVTRTYIREVRSVLSREKVPSVAAADLEKELVDISGFRTGPPSK
jgi:trehalose/maltose transport system substrate-binding protein